MLQNSRSSFLNAGKDDEYYGKKKNGKSKILYGTHLGHRKSPIIEYFESLFVFHLVALFS